MAWTAYKVRPMKIDSLKQYVTIRSALLSEKAAIESRLAQINQALRGDVAIAAPAPVKAAAPAPVKAVVAAPARSLSRVQNPMSLKAAVAKVTTSKPLTKPEILAAIHKLGYRFVTNNPGKSLDVILYTKGDFKRGNGRFSPAK